MYPDVYISRQSRRVGIITFASMALVSFLNAGHIVGEALVFAVLCAIISSYGTAVALDWYRERNYPVTVVQDTDPEPLPLPLPTAAPKRATAHESTPAAPTMHTAEFSAPRAQIVGNGGDNANGLQRAPRHYAAFVSAVTNGKINKRHISNRALADALGISRFPENPEAQNLMSFLQERGMVQQRGQVWELVE